MGFCMRGWFVLVGVSAESPVGTDCFCLWRFFDEVGARSVRGFFGDASGIWVGFDFGIGNVILCSPS